LGLLLALGCLATTFSCGERQLASEKASEGGNPVPPATELPKDIYPDSGSRLPMVRREDLDEAGKKIYDEYASDSRSLMGLRGPAGIRLHSPRLAEASRSLSTYLRFGTKLEPRLVQLATLVTARETDQQFEWNAHEPAARKAGLKPEVIEVVKHRKPLAGLSPEEEAIIRLGRELFVNHKVSSETFAAAMKLFGRETMVDLVALMGYYSFSSALLTTFDQQLPPGKSPQLPKLR
jgi:4-carboxymuconolactone decarboxylase